MKAVMDLMKIAGESIDSNTQWKRLRFKLTS